MEISSRAKGKEKMEYPEKMEISSRAKGSREPSTEVREPPSLGKKETKIKGKKKLEYLANKKLEKTVKEIVVPNVDELLEADLRAAGYNSEEISKMVYAPKEAEPETPVIGTQQSTTEIKVTRQNPIAVTDTQQTTTLRRSKRKPSNSESPAEHTRWFPKPLRRSGRTKKMKYSNTPTDPITL